MSTNINPCSHELLGQPEDGASADFVSLKAFRHGRLANLSDSEVLLQKAQWRCLWGELFKLHTECCCWRGEKFVPIASSVLQTLRQLASIGRYSNTVSLTRYKDFSNPSKDLFLNMFLRLSAPREYTWCMHLDAGTPWERRSVDDSSMCGVRYFEKGDRWMIPACVVLNTLRKEISGQFQRVWCWIP